MKILKINQINPQNSKQQSTSFKAIQPDVLYKPMKDYLKLFAKATVPLALATIAIQNKDSKIVPNEEEFTKALRKMTRPDGNPRFKDEDIDYLLRFAYKEDPALTWRVVNLKSKDNDWVIDNKCDITNTALYYKQHPEISETIFKDVQNSDRKVARKLIQYTYIDSTNQEMLFKLYNIRTQEGLPSVEFYQVNDIIKAYQENPELYEKLLTEKDINGNIARSGNDILNIYNAYKINPEVVDTLLNIVDCYKMKLSGSSILEIASRSEEDRKFYIELLQMKDCNGSRFSKFDIDGINILKNGNIYKSGENPTRVINELLYIKNFNGEYLCKPKDIINIAGFGDLEQQNFIIKLLKCGIKPEKAIKLSTNLEYDKIYFLIKNDVSMARIENAIISQELDELVNETKQKTRPMKEFFTSPNYKEQLLKNSAGKFQKELMELLDPQKAPYILKSGLFDSDLAVEDFLSALKKISKSSFKLAYDTPNQYIDGLDSTLSTSINGHYPKLSQEELALERQKVVKFYAENMPSLMRMLKFIDIDTVNHLMDKRFKLFEEELNLIDKTPKELLEKFRNLSQCNSKNTRKALSVKERMQLYNILKIFSITKIDTTPLDEAIRNNSIDIEKLKKNIYSKILEFSDVDVDIDNLDEKRKFNENYAYFVLNPSMVNTLTENERLTIKESFLGNIKDMREDKTLIEDFKLETEEILLEGSRQCKKVAQILFNALDNIEKHTDDELLNLIFDLYVTFNETNASLESLYTVIREGTNGNFENFIKSPENIFGQANLKTQKIFAKKGLSYEQYSKPEIPDVKFELAGKNYKIKLWDRNPYEDLFMGNKTSCCTAIGRINGSSTPLYLMNTCWNVVQMFDEKGEVVGMSRVFVGENNGEISLMMDNIELNNKLVANMSPNEKIKIRNKFFEYMHNYAQKITGNHKAKVYFYTGDTHVPTNDLKTFYANIDFIGENATDSVYINSYGLRWGDPKKFKEYTSSWYIIPKN